MVKDYMELSNLLILILLLIIVFYLFSTKRKKIKPLKANDPLSPLYNWHLLDNLDEENLYTSWNEIFKSELVSLESFNLSLSKKEVSPHWRDNCEFFLSEIGKHYNLEEDIVIVNWNSSAESWEHLAGRAGYVFISKKEKKQIHFLMTMGN